MNGQRELVPRLREEDQAIQTVIGVPVILGNVYEGEEERICGTCGTGRLMWYVMPEDMEILICTDPRCCYPFDDTSDYVIRSRLHGLVPVGGPESSSVQPAAPTSTGTDLVPHGYGASSEEIFNKLVEEYNQLSEEDREPEVDATVLIDHGGLNAVMKCIKRMEEDDDDPSGGVD